MYHETIWHFESKNAFIKSMCYVTQHTISNLDVLSLATSVRFCISPLGKITFLTFLLVSASTYCMTDNLPLYKWSGYYIHDNITVWFTDDRLMLWLRDGADHCQNKSSSHLQMCGLFHEQDKNTVFVIYVWLTNALSIWELS
jgi:hypothetical protein